MTADGGGLVAPNDESAQSESTQRTQHLASKHAPSEGMSLPQTADNASRGVLYAVFAGALSALGAGLMRRRNRTSYAKERKDR